MSADKSCLVAAGVAVPPCATKTVLSPWLAAYEGRVSHVLSHVVLLYIDLQPSQAVKIGNAPV